MRVVFVQFGDYKEAYLRLKSGGKENYYAQKYTVGFVEELAKTCAYVGVFTVSCQYAEEGLAGNVHVFGTKIYEEGLSKLFEMLEKVLPTHLICCFPNRHILRYGIEKKIKVLPLLADSFDQGGIRTFFRNLLLKNILQNDAIKWVANHQINACLSLKRIGVSEKKIIPWDYPPLNTPENFPEKKHALKTPVQLLYAGSVSTAKGVEEAILAVFELLKKKIEAHLTIAGDGEIEKMKVLGEKLGISAQLNFLGRIDHEKIIPLMQENDIILIPSRHEYPEGLPLTIYEAFCSKTPIIASDHPMFKGKIVDKESGLIFKEKEPKELGNCIKALIDDKELYEKLSANAIPAWKKLQLETFWADLISSWLKEDDKWLEKRSLYFASNPAIS